MKKVLPWWLRPVWDWQYYQDKDNRLSKEEKGVLRSIYKRVVFYYLICVVFFPVVYLLAIVKLKVPYTGFEGLFFLFAATPLSFWLARRGAVRVDPVRAAIADERATLK